jgi:hypothetical protein
MPFLIAGGASVLGGVLGRNKKTTSTSSVQLTPEQQKVQGLLSNQLAADLENPHKPRNPTPLRSTLRAGVNQTAAGSKQRFEEDLSSRGFGRSGGLAAGFSNIETGRLNTISSIDAQILQFLEEQEQADEQRAVDNALRFLPNQGTQVSETRGGGDPFGDAFESFGSIFALQQLLGAGGFGGGGGGQNPQAISVDRYGNRV